MRNGLCGAGIDAANPLTLLLLMPLLYPLLMVYILVTKNATLKCFSGKMKDLKFPRLQHFEFTVAHSSAGRGPP